MSKRPNLAAIAAAAGSTRRAPEPPPPAAPLAPAGAKTRIGTKHGKPELAPLDRARGLV